MNRYRQYVKLKWSDPDNKDPVERSPLTRPREIIEPEEPHTPRAETPPPKTHSDDTMQSIRDQEIREQLTPHKQVEALTTTSRFTNTKREDTYSKMAEREMVRQVGLNPFMNTDYVEGVTIRDKFLMPYYESKPNISKASEEERS
jgi:hypothetical protein